MSGSLQSIYFPNAKLGVLPSLPGVNYRPNGRGCTMVSTWSVQYVSRYQNWLLSNGMMHAAECKCSTERLLKAKVTYVEETTRRFNSRKL